MAAWTDPDSFVRWHEEEEGDRVVGHIEAYWRRSGMEGTAGDADPSQGDGRQAVERSWLLVMARRRMN